MTCVEFLGHIGGLGIDMEVAKNFQRILKKQGLDFKLNTKVTNASRNGDNVKVEVEGVKDGKKEEVSRFSCYMSCVMRKPTFCICENKDADQLRGNREADQRLCFRYIYSTISLLSKSEISTLQLSSVAVQSRLCRTRSETRMLVFS